MSVLHTLGTAHAMEMDGLEMLKSDDPMRQAQGQELLDMARRIFEGVTRGDLEAYVTNTVWARDDAGGVTAGETSVSRVIYPQTPIRTEPRHIVIHPAGPRGRRDLSVGLVPLRPADQVTLTSDGNDSAAARAAAQSALSGLDHRVRQARAQGARVVLFPEDTVVITRTDGGSSYSELLADPTLGEIRRIAEATDTYVMLGVNLDRAGDKLRLGVFVARPDGTARFVPHNANLRESGLARERIDGVEVGIALCADARCVVDPSADLHLVSARARASELDRFLSGLPNSLGVNWNPPDLPPRPLVVENRWR